MKEERIQKVMAEQGYCSRRAAEKLIEQGKVQLNGRPVKLGDKMDIKNDILTVNGQRVAMQRRVEYVYYMLNKPRGYISTLKDEMGRKAVSDLVADIPQRVLPIGRLDKDSEGLLLFTNDGAFINELTHPSHEVSKVYRTTVRPHATEAQITKLAAGVDIGEGERTLPCTARVLVDEPDRTVIELVIREGKNRQVRRMCEAVGLQVVRLRRTQIGPVKLGMLAPGKTRELTPAEVLALKGSTAKAKRQATSAAQRKQGAEKKAAMGTGKTPKGSKRALRAAAAAGHRKAAKDD